MLFAVHSASLRWLAHVLLRHDYLWYFQAGLAGQYVLGPIFHPSIFGVLLLLSIYPSVQDRRSAAAGLRPWRRSAMRPISSPPPF